ncbi:hypothetical protein B0H14DRAFT_892792 [Mycena olivaceomarginata]|nr:hypothetical protein B0H14DRAFT_892792 [Mycena olivaceomarginata]
MASWAQPTPSSRSTRPHQGAAHTRAATPPSASPSAAPRPGPGAPRPSTHPRPAPSPSRRRSTPSPSAAPPSPARRPPSPAPAPQARASAARASPPGSCSTRRPPRPRPAPARSRRSPRRVRAHLSLNRTLQHHLRRPRLPQRAQAPLDNSKNQQLVLRTRSPARGRPIAACRMGACFFCVPSEFGSWAGCVPVGVRGLYGAGAYGAAVRVCCVAGGRRRDVRVGARTQRMARMCAAVGVGVVVGGGTRLRALGPWQGPEEVKRSEVK